MCVANGLVAVVRLVRLRLFYLLLLLLFGVVVCCCRCYCALRLSMLCAVGRCCVLSLCDDACCVLHFVVYCLMVSTVAVRVLVAVCCGLL